MEYLSYLFIYSSIFLANSIVILAIKNLFIKKWSNIDDLLLVLISFLLTESFSLLYSPQYILLVTCLFINILLLFLAKAIFKNYSYAGLNFYIANYMMTAVGIFWGLEFILGLHISLITRILLTITSPLLILTLPSDNIKLLEQYDVLCRDTWLRPKNPFPTRVKLHTPMVSLHVPAHS